MGAAGLGILGEMKRDEERERETSLC